MNDTHCLKRGLYVQGLPIYEADLPYISNILSTIKQTEASTDMFPDLNAEVPIVVVDKELLL